MSEPVLYTVSGGVAEIALNRPERRNALSFQLIDALLEAFNRCAKDHEVKLVLMTGAPPAFCAGIDLRSIDLLEPKHAKRFAHKLAEIYQVLLACPLPILCGADGAIRGGGVGLVAAADVVWVGPKVTWGLPEARLGLIPAMVSLMLRRRMNTASVNALAISGEVLDAADMLRTNLADFVVEERTAAEFARERARRMLRDNSAKAMKRTKQFLNNERERPSAEAFTAAEAAFVKTAATAEAKRGLEAFRNRQPIVWDDEA